LTRVAAPLQLIIEQVTRSLAEMHFFNQENKVRSYVMSMLEAPVRQMKEQEGLIKLIKGANENNIRRLQEVEFVIHKFQRTVSQLDET
jgi:hypothetical protein